MAGTAAIAQHYVGRSLPACAAPRVKPSLQPLWTGGAWYGVDDPELDAAPQLAVYCPACAKREFGDDRTG